MVGLEVPVQEDDVVAPLDFEAQPLEVADGPVAVDDLEHQGRPTVGVERPSIGLDQTERVLPLEDAQHVEAEEEDERVGRNPEVLATHPLGDRRSHDGMGNA